MPIPDLAGVTDLDCEQLQALQGGDGESALNPIPEEDIWHDPVLWQWVAGAWRYITSPPPSTTTG